VLFADRITPHVAHLIPHAFGIWAVLLSKVLEVANLVLAGCWIICHIQTLHYCLTATASTHRCTPCVKAVTLLLNFTGVAVKMYKFSTHFPCRLCVSIVLNCVSLAEIWNKVVKCRYWSVSFRNLVQFSLLNSEEKQQKGHLKWQWSLNCHLFYFILFWLFMLIHCESKKLHCFFSQ